jgi:diacylglycerol kinase (ATP)
MPRSTTACSLGDFGFADILTRGRRLYKRTHLTMAKVTTRRAKVVEAEPIDPAGIVELDIDGEAPGRLPARFEILPGALWFVTPS